jgi:hypothetical protein
MVRNLFIKIVLCFCVSMFSCTDTRNSFGAEAGQEETSMEITPLSSSLEPEESVHPLILTSLLLQVAMSLSPDSSIRSNTEELRGKKRSAKREFKEANRHKERKLHVHRHQNSRKRR